MQNYNLHTHSVFSDGKSTLREHVEAAVRQGFCSLGFSEHGPLPFDNDFSVRCDDMPKYVGELEQLKAEFLGKIVLYSGLEMDYISSVSEEFSVVKQRYNLDYVIGGVHLVGESSNPDEIWFIDGPDWQVYDEGLLKFFHGDIRRAVRRFFEQSNEMLEKEQFDIMAHFDKIKMHNRERYFHEDEAWYRGMALETLDLIRQKGVVMEVNTRGLYKKRYNGFYPSPWLMAEACKMGVPAVISADAHHCSELGLEFDEAATALRRAGYRCVMRPDAGRWVECAL